MVAMVGMFVAIQGFILAYWGPNPETITSLLATTPCTCSAGSLTRLTFG